MQVPQLLAVSSFCYVDLKTTKQTWNGSVINLLAETYQKLSLEKTVCTGFLMKGPKSVASTCTFCGLYGTTETEK